MSEQQKKLILSIDDDEDILLMIQMLLNKDGYAVKIATSAEKAAEILKKEENPDLILLDVNMPEINGYQFAQKLQQHPKLSLIPIVFLTARKTEADRVQALASGGVDFLSKPISQSRLQATIKAHLKTQDQWQKRFEEQALVVNTAAKVEPATENKLPAVASEFNRFKEFLLITLSLDNPSREQFIQIAPHELYQRTLEWGLSSQHVSQALATFLHLEYLSTIEPATVNLGVLPTPFCKKNQVIPLRLAPDKAAFVISNPFNIELTDELKRFKNTPILITDPENIEVLFGGTARSTNALELKRQQDMAHIVEEIRPKFDTAPKAATPEAETIDADLEDDAPIVRLANQLMADAYKMGASDIHIEPAEQEIQVRYRIDGELRIVHRLQPAKLIQPLVSRIKIMSKLNIAEKRLPQDGRIVFKEFTREKLDFDLRVSVAPMNFGEKVVMRIIDKQKTALPLDKLGFSARNLALYREKIKTPYGMILHVGPTGSGKSMTLYAALNELKRPEINIHTAEDPIEYTLPGINQMQMHRDIGLTFASALRTFLRQDPDIILVGEIRDRETAHTAVEAALTGHLLLSTLHTNDAAGTMIRFIEMGIEPFMISSCIVLVCAQRLIRLLCPQCKQAYPPTPEEKELLGPLAHTVESLFRAKGCEACNHIGYKGRLGVHEILVPNDATRQIINKPGLTAEELKYIAVKDCGMTTLYWDAMDKVTQGLSSIEEVLTRIRRDEFDSTPLWLREKVLK